VKIETVQGNRYKHLTITLQIFVKKATSSARFNCFFH